MVESTTAPKLLLIVEDNDVSRESLAALLRRQGYSILEAINGGQAMEVLRQETPDLILLDMLMPGGDGWTLLAALRHKEDWSAVPVIIVTGLRIASPEWAVSLGAQAVVQKPIDTDELLQKIKHICV